VLDTLLARSSVAPTSPLDLPAAQSLVASRHVSAVDISDVWDALRAMPPSIPAGARAAFDSASRRASTEVFRRVAASATPPAMWYSAASVTSSDASPLFNDLLTPSKPATVASLSPVAIDQAAASVVSLIRGDRADAVRRAREILGVARMLTRDPLPIAHRHGVGMAGIGARLLEEIGVATGDGVLMREGLQLEHAIQARRDAESAVNLFSLMSIAVVPGDTSLIALAGTHGALPVDRWAAIDAIAHGECWNAAEVRIGSSSVRRERLRSAAARLDDIEHSLAWIAFQTRFLDDFDRAAFSRAALAGAPPLVDRTAPLVRFGVCGFRR
jgi:hypothetical protein